MSRRAIRYIGRKAAFHPYLALPLVAVLTVLAGWSAITRLEIEMDVATLLPKDSSIYQEKNRTEWLFGLGNYDYLFCVLEMKDSAPADVQDDPAAFLKFAKSRIQPALSDGRYFIPRGELMGGGEPLGFERIPAAPFAVLTLDDLDRIEQRVLPDKLGDNVRRLLTPVDDMPTTAVLALRREDPFGVREIVAERSLFLSGPLKNYWNEGHFISDDGQMLLFVLWPAKPSTNLVRARELMLFLNETREGMYARNPAWRNSLNIDFVGPHVENAEGTTDVREDMVLTSLVSLLAVMFLFIVAFRQPEALLFVVVPLLVGVVWTLGLASLFVERITQVTLTFAAILIGLGIDFSIHLYNRYLEDVRLGRSARASINSAMQFTGPSIVAGALTTGFAFFGMMLTQFEGFRELGLFGGVGIIMCLLAMALTLPPMMVLSSSFLPTARGPLATLGLKKVTYTVQSYPRITVCAGMCIVVFLGLQATEVRFDDDFHALRQPSDSYERLVRRIESHFAMPSNQLLVIVEGDDPVDALLANDLVYRNLRSARIYANFGVDSLRVVHPAPDTQMQLLRRFLLIPVDSIRERLRLVEESEELIPEGYFSLFIEWLAESRRQVQQVVAVGEAPVSLEKVQDIQFDTAVYNFLQHDAQRRSYTVITRVYPPSYQVWDDASLALFEDTVGEGLNTQPVILGNAILSSGLRLLIVRDLSLVVLVVTLSIAVYLIWYFRSFKRAALAMIPVGFAVLCMLGGMQILGISLNYLNIIALPMVIGIGVDSAIHLLGRFYENERHNMRVAVERTGRAIMVTGLTTIFGFGSLTFASFRGIREIGVLAIIGTLCTLFAALFLLPAVLRLMDSKYTYKGGPGDEIG